MLARDLQSIVLYDQQGKFVGVRRPNSKLPIDIDGIKIVIVDAIGSTGLDIKVINLPSTFYVWSLPCLLFDIFFFSFSFHNYCTSLFPYRLTLGCQLFMLVLVP